MFMPVDVYLKLRIFGSWRSKSLYGQIRQQQTCSADNLEVNQSIALEYTTYYAVHWRNAFAINLKIAVQSTRVSLAWESK